MLSQAKVHSAKIGKDIFKMDQRHKNSEFTHIKNVLKKYVREKSRNSAGDLMHVIEIWETKMDKTIYENSRPDSLKNGILTLKILSPAWSQQILFIKKNLMETINAGSDFEIVKDIKCRITAHF